MFPIVGQTAGPIGLKFFMDIMCGWGMSASLFIKYKTKTTYIPLFTGYDCIFLDTLERKST